MTREEFNNLNIGAKLRPINPNIHVREGYVVKKTENGVEIDPYPSDPCMSTRIGGHFSLFELINSERKNV